MESGKILSLPSQLNTLNPTPYTLLLASGDEIRVTFHEQRIFLVRMIPQG
jgi:hypothetical protein